MIWAMLSEFSRPVGSARQMQRHPRRRSPRRSQRVGQMLQGANAVLVRLREVNQLAGLGHAPARLVRIGKERHRRRAADQDQLLRRRRETRQPARRNRECAPPARGRRPSRHAAQRCHTTAVRRSWLECARPPPARRRQGAAAQQHRRLLAIRHQSGNVFDGIRRHDRRPDIGQTVRGALGRIPGGVGGQDQVAMPPGAARAACTALAASPAASLALLVSWIQPDTGRAKPAMSDVSNASYCR